MQQGCGQVWPKLQMEQRFFSQIDEGGFKRETRLSGLLPNVSAKQVCRVWCCVDQRQQCNKTKKKSMKKKQAACSLCYSWLICDHNKDR